MKGRWPPDELTRGASDAGKYLLLAWEESQQAFWGEKSLGKSGSALAGSAVLRERITDEYWLVSFLLTDTSKGETGATWLSAGLVKLLAVWHALAGSDWSDDGDDIEGRGLLYIG